jgi:hypothetical protein
LLTSPEQAHCNDGVAGSARDEEADVIAAGREPRSRSLRLGSLARWLVVAETAALVIAAAAAVHYRAEAGGLKNGGSPAAIVPAAPEVASVALQLLAGGGVTGSVVITAAVLPGAKRSQFTVDAVITGGVPGTFYSLIGSDCSTADPTPDDVWATGLAGPDGTADLTGYAWTGEAAVSYWMDLTPTPVTPEPGLHGQFAQGRAAPFPAGQAPCAQ